MLGSEEGGLTRGGRACSNQAKAHDVIGTLVGPEITVRRKKSTRAICGALALFERGVWAQYFSEMVSVFGACPQRMNTSFLGIVIRHYMLDVQGNGRLFSGWCYGPTNLRVQGNAGWSYGPTMLFSKTTVCLDNIGWKHELLLWHVGECFEDGYCADISIFQTLDKCRHMDDHSEYRYMHDRLWVQDLRCSYLNREKLKTENLT